MSEERKAGVTVAELQDNGCLTGDCPHGSASDCLDHLTLMIGMLRDSDGEEDARPRADLPPIVVTRIQNFLDGHPADDTIIKLADAKGRPFTHVTAGWLRSVLATYPAMVTEAMVEELALAVARVACTYGDECFEWDADESSYNYGDPEKKNHILGQMKSALTAALGGAR